MKIIVDAMGGDNAPLEVLKGCIEAKNEYSLDIILVGDKEVINNCAKDNSLDISAFEILHASQIISMNDSATDVLKTKSDSSIAVGLKALKEGRADAFSSAGNSGALVMGATTIVKRIKGIKRVCFCAIIPNADGFSMITDTGANIECRPEMIDQFATMASVYMKKVMGIISPKVGLLNCGTEEHKGTSLHIAAHNLMKENKKINFYGNVEGRDLPLSTVDIIVTDGFTGNAALKTYEGVAKVLMGKVKDVFKKNIFTKLAALIVLKEINKLKKELDYNEYGGAPIIGAVKPVFKIHGSAKAKTVKNGIRLTMKYVESGAIETLQEAFSKSE